ncbi:MAG: helix-turn-helix domain-containing protein [Zymomonas mobilis subsp. pomaceae]|uniref:Transcriptional regulator, MerR family n=1 Tax=Zymomonas mobilis subsp. pomaceae (strain ATCC 29192 / DSM 22645 / JCM 10191 / CCUG 17912 / NBRC 13757 / NCIMB 11200 / NRRL B-4491 / Barker I) TaxID=579138 RepID=F8EST3_ZYMMT|nr:helix-turn-helix domain-containing protein [Zymomonas mobilis]AEI37858.1 transcriptional regulator, MerR family [Zymomonas mobilis subsp. pomaceae ATCC 29192]MDX5949225.1 helix-turn-helix domain-containing protein [Zymomonas mobilis subsp. pomaceae]GEB89546.1 MerR family transcriptional regulator [Zymomonas mobilis subsp. pomaceae]
MNRDYFTIGALAKKTETKIVTIRYYESIGLLPEPPRTEGNYRLYNHHHLMRLTFIRRCRSLGFTLHDVRELITLAERRDQNCKEVDHLARNHLEAIEHKIQDLTKLALELRCQIESCRGGTMANCHILEALSS